jgi:hypothetical protein
MKSKESILTCRTAVDGTGCYEHDKTTGTIGSGSVITASRIQGTWELVSLIHRNHGVRDHVMD